MAEDSKALIMSAALRAYAERQTLQKAVATPTANDDAEAAYRGPAGSTNTYEAPPLVGKMVIINGLLARPELNGLVGDCQSFDAGRGRYCVVVKGETMALKPSNLELQKSNSADATAFGPSSRIRIKGLVAKPELNECGGTVVEWNSEKERYVIQLDGSLKTMLLRAQNLERDRRERWEPEMPTPQNLAHIQEETDRYIREQAANSNPFASMDPTGELFKKKSSEPSGS